MSGQLTTRQIIKRLIAGETITVRAKNGDCYPTFRDKPSAYRCKLGKTALTGSKVWELINRKRIECANPGWYSEGTFRLRADE